MLELELPYPPSVNHYWRRVGNRTLISRGGRTFRAEVCQLLRSHKPEPLAGPLEVSIQVHPPDRRRRDLDNCLKSLLDAMQHGGVYHDDSQIVRLAIEKCPPTPGGKTLVRIRELSHAPPGHRQSQGKATVPEVPEGVLVAKRS